MSVGVIVDTVGGCMPKSCDGCPFEMWNHNAMEYTCVMNEYDLRTPEERSKSIGDWCPLQEVEPVRHGRWRALWGYDSDLREPTEDFECTVCREQYKVGNYNYCPNCGAKMDGKSEG